MNEETLFNLVLEKPSHERSAFLDSACGEDEELRRRVERLLKAHDNPGSFMQEPVLQATGGSPSEATQALEPGAATPVHGGKTQTGLSQTVHEDLAFLAPATRPDSLGRLEHYHVLDVIGKGGFGTVLKAFDEKLHRVVAIKVLSVELSASGTARQRFIREARTAAAVSHEHVVTIHAVVEEHRPPYLVMQMIDGVTLQEKLDKVGTLSLREILRIGMQMAEGLAAAHKQGLVHRDIKPANILLENGVERVKITDFGLAKIADDASVTQSGVVAGTPMYMSPEQANGETLDHRSDLFSLGTVLYVMCTGRPPFRASGTMGVLKRVIDDTPRPVREINAEVPDWLEAIINKLHAKNPEDRFQTAKEVAEVLGQRLADLQAGRAIEGRAEGRKAPGEAPASESLTRPLTGLGSPRRSWLAWLAAALLFAIGGLTTFAGASLMTSPEGVLTPQGRFAAPLFLVGGIGLLAWCVFFLVRGSIWRWLTGLTAALLCCASFVAPMVYHRLVPIPPSTARLEVTTQAREVRVEVIQAGDPDNKHVFPPQEILGQLFDRRVPVGDWKVIAYRGDKVHYQTTFTLHAHETRRVIIPETPTVEPPEEPGWVQLFNGKDLTGWKPHPNWRVEEGVLIGAGSVSKDSKGTLASKSTFLLTERRDFDDFHLRVEVRVFSDECDSGVIFRSSGGTWQELNISFEPKSPGAQTGSLFVKKSKDKGDWISAAPGLGKLGEWMTLEVIARGPHVITKVNGKTAVETHEAIGGTRSGLSLQQFGSATVVHFRKIEIKELPSDSAKIELVRRMEGHSGAIRNIEFFRDGKKLASIARWDRKLRIWNFPAGTLDFEIPVEKGLYSMALAPDGNRAVLALGQGDEGVVEMWDLQTRKRLWSNPGHNTYIKDVSFAHDGRRVLSGGGDGKVILWDADNGKILDTIQNLAKVFVAKFSPDRKHIVIGNDMGNLQVLDAHTLKKVHEVQTPGRRAILCSSFSRDGSRMLVGTMSGTVYWFDPLTGKLKEALKSDTPYGTVALLANERYAVTGAGERLLQIWDLQTGTEIARVEPEFHVTREFAVSPDGRHVVSGAGFRFDKELKKDVPDKDAALYLWRLPERVMLPPTEFGWVQLFNGKDLQGWTMTVPNSWKLENGLLVNQGRTHLWSQKSDYRDVHVRVELKVDSDYAMLGVRRKTGAGAAGVTLGNTNENRNIGSLFQIDELGKTKIHVRSAMDVKPDTWHVGEVIIRGNDMTVLINGKITGRHSLTGLLDAGSVGLGVIQGTIHVRKIEIKKLPPEPIPVDLLALIDPATHSLDPGVTKKDGVLHTPRRLGSKNTRVLIPYKPVPEEYDLHLLAERKGTDGLSLNFGIVMGGRQAQLAMDGGGKKKAWCIEHIDGKSMHSGNVTCVLGQRFHVGKKVRVVLQVRKTGIRAICDGETVIDWKGKAEQLSLWGEIHLPDQQSLFFFSQAEFAIYELSLHPFVAPPDEPGWVKLFNGKNLDGWNIQDKGDWSVPGSGSIYCTTTAAPAFLNSVRDDFENFHLKAKIYLTPYPPLAKKAFPASAKGAIWFRNTPGLNGYQALFSTLAGQTGQLAVREGKLGALTLLTKAPAVSMTEKTWFDYEIIANGTNITVKVDGKETTKVTDSHWRRGQIVPAVDPRGIVRFKDIEIKELPPEEPGWVQLFNGTDLTGWDKPAEPAWTVENGDLVCRKGVHISLFYRARPYTDFHLRVVMEYRDMPVFGLGFRGDIGLKPSAPKAYEALIGMGARPGAIIKVAGNPPTLAQGIIAPKEDLPARHTWEVIAIGSKIKVLLDGVLVSEAEDAAYSKGKVYLMPRFGNIEGRFKKIEIRALPPAIAVAPFDGKKAKDHQDAWAKHLGVDVEMTNSIGMKLRLIPPGTFLMGAAKEEIDEFANKTTSVHAALSQGIPLR